jgi:hypothetical protein
MGEVSVEDIPIDFADQRYTLRDAAFLARVPDMSVRNWQSRKLFTAGRTVTPVWCPFKPRPPSAAT